MDDFLSIENYQIITGYLVNIAKKKFKSNINISDYDKKIYQLMDKIYKDNKNLGKMKGNLLIIQLILADIEKDVLNNSFEIEKGFMTTIHSFTTDQRILDNSHKDPRRARSASQSIIPTSTGASKAIGEIIPSLKGKLQGVAMRVPTPNVSLVELVFCTKKEITKEKINTNFIK